MAEGDDTTVRKVAKRMEDRDLPIPIEAFGKKGKIVEIRQRTRCTRRYFIIWDNEEHGAWYKGAATRPHWIKHLGKGVKETAK